MSILHLFLVHHFFMWLNMPNLHCNVTLYIFGGGRFVHRHVCLHLHAHVHVCSAVHSRQWMRLCQRNAILHCCSPQGNTHYTAHTRALMTAVHVQWQCQHRVPPAGKGGNSYCNWRQAVVRLCTKLSAREGVSRVPSLLFIISLFYFMDCRE